MEKRNTNFLNYIYIYAVALIVFVAWFFSYQYVNELLIANFDVTQIGFIIIGVIVFFVLSLLKDTIYMMPLLVFTPFMFANGFNETSIPIGLYIVVGGAVLGIIIHLIRFRTKFKFGSYFIGLLAFLLGVMFSGILNSHDLVTQLILIGVGGTLILCAYIFITSYFQKNYFNELCHLMIALGFIMVFESFAQQILMHPGNMFWEKTILLGWGLSNNVAMILLMCSPFVMYKCTESKGFKNLIYLLILILFICTLVLTYSRGSLFILLLTFPIFMIYSFINSKFKKQYLLNCSIVLLVLVAIVVYIYFTERRLIDDIIRTLSRINLSSLNGRGEIYEKMLMEAKENLWFGRGIFNSSNKEGNDYLWGHNVYIHTLYTTGLFGLAALFIHLFQKYYLLLKKPNTKKVFVAIAFLACGLYGLMDVTYFYLNYMIVMIAILALVEHEVKE